MPSTPGTPDNGGFAVSSQPPDETPDATLLMGLRDGESEPVLVVVDEGCAVFDLDDGSRLELDLTEVKAALADHHTIRCEACGRIGLDDEPSCDHFSAWWITARGWGEWRPWGRS